MKSQADKTIDWNAFTLHFPLIALMPQRLKNSSNLVDIHRGNVLYRIGDQVSNALCVLDGEVKLVRTDQFGKETVLQRSNRGFFAEASLNQSHYHCDIVVIKNGMLLEFPTAVFWEAIDNNKPFRDAWLSHLAKELKRLRGQCERMNLRSATDRVLHYIESEGQEGVLMLNQNRKIWASELGLTHEALYRALARLQAQQAIVIEGNKIATKRLLTFQ